MTEPGIPHNPSNPPERDDPAGQEGARPPLREDIRARTMRPHKGDVGRAGTNEEIFQGSKQKELH